MERYIPISLELPLEFLDLICQEKIVINGTEHRIKIAKNPPLYTEPVLRCIALYHIIDILPYPNPIIIKRLLNNKTYILNINLLFELSKSLALPFIHPLVLEEEGCPKHGRVHPIHYPVAGYDVLCPVCLKEGQITPLLTKEKRKLIMQLIDILNMEIKEEEKAKKIYEITGLALDDIGFFLETGVSVESIIENILKEVDRKL